jgi:glycosyltransferase involved in cell wall biosynthesis
MKVAHVISRFAPGGGVVSIVRETSLRLRDRGIDVEVFAGKPVAPGATPPPSDPDPLPVQRFPYGRSQRIKFPLMVGLEDALVRSGADVIHAHFHRTGHVLQAARASRRSGVPLVVSTYYHPAHRTEPRPKKAAIRLLDFAFGLGAYGRAGALLTLSHFEVGKVRPFAFSAPIRVVPPGIDLAQWASPSTDRRDPRLPPEYFVYSGRIAWDKGLDVLVRALAAVPPGQRKPLVLVGPEVNYGFQASLEKLARELGVADLLIFLGHVGDPAMYRGALRGAKALVLASEWESFGIVLLEAMAAGTPVIASRAGAMPEVVDDGRAGLLVPYGDPRALAEAMQSIDRDPEGARRRVQRGLERVRSFDWAVTAEAFRTVYEEVGARHPSPRRRGRTPPTPSERR